MTTSRVRILHLDHKLYCMKVDMEDFYTKIQILLMKYDIECGQLKFLKSRTTIESVNHIENLCKSVSESFKACEIETGNANVKEVANCVQAFKYLVLNTDFKAQEYFVEDFASGHLADICPPLSPYLLIEILWHLNYEEILAESLLHVPLDLSVEILESARKCIERLNFKRALNILITLIINAYKKVILVRDVGSQTEDITEDLNGLMINVHELILLLSNSKITRLNELSTLEKYERYGLILKKILQMTRCCLESSKDGVTIAPNLDNIYKITYGRKPMVHCEITDLENNLCTFDKELVNLLVKKVKEVDCNIYLGWAELQDTEDNTITLQRSIGMNCYDFIQAAKNNDRLTLYGHLMECLQQLSSNPEPKIVASTLSLQELCTGVDEGKKEYIKELISRCKELDDSTFVYIEKNQSLMDKNDCLQLLEYLFYLIPLPVEESYKQRVHTTTTRILFLQSILDIFDIVLQYILKHDASNALECPYTEENFNDFIVHNINLRSSMNLRTILLFIIQNPKKILSMLLKIAIGYPEYSNIMISLDDLFLLSPFMNIRQSNAESLLTNTLRNVCMEHTAWNTKKFTDLIQALLDRRVFTADDIFNKIFIPYLESSVFMISNMKTVLNCIRTMKDMCTKELNVHTLLLALGKRMSDLRKNIDLSKYINNEILSFLIRLIEYFTRNHCDSLNADKKKETIDQLHVFLEPIDLPYFTYFEFFRQCKMSVVEIIENYKTQCFVIARKVDDSEKTKNYIHKFFNVQFLCHLLLRCTEMEYMSIGSECTMYCADYFGWFDIVSANGQFAQLTIFICLFCIEFPKLSPPDTFAFLIKCLAKYTKWFASIDAVKDYIKMIYEYLVKSIYMLEKSVSRTSYSQLYSDLLRFTNNNTANGQPTIQNVYELVQAIDNFGNRCLEIEHDQIVFNSSPSPNIVQLQLTIQFISACTKASGTEAYEYFSKLHRTLFPKHYTDKEQN